MQVMQAAFFFIVFLQGTVAMELPETEKTVTASSTHVTLSNENICAETGTIPKSPWPMLFFLPSDSAKLIFGSTRLYAFCAHPNSVIAWASQTCQLKSSSFQGISLSIPLNFFCMYYCLSEVMTSFIFT